MWKELYFLICDTFAIFSDVDFTENENEFLLQAKKNSSDINNSELLQQSMQLSIIVLQHRKMFEIQDMIEAMIKNLWFIMLKQPCTRKNLLELLLAIGLKECYELLRLLHDHTVISLLINTYSSYIYNLFLFCK